MASAKGEYPAVAYQQVQLAEEQNDHTQQQAQPQDVVVEMAYTPENQAIISNSKGWVYCLLTIQMIVSIPTWPSESVFIMIFPYFNLFMAILGFIGVRHEKLGFIVPHFLYTMCCMFGLIFIFSMGVFYCVTCGASLIPLAVIILLTSFLLRKQRLLIQALCSKKVPVMVDMEDPMIVELPLETPVAPAGQEPYPSAPAADQAVPFYPSFPQQEGAVMMQPVPMIVQAEDGTQQIVYMYPVMPNPYQFAPAPEAPAPAPAKEVQQ